MMKKLLSSIVFLLFFLAPEAQGAISLVQNKNNFNPSAAVNIVTVSSTVAGDAILIVAVTDTSGRLVSEASSSKGDVAIFTGARANLNQPDAEIWYIPSLSANATSINVDWGGTALSTEVWIYEVSGLASNMLDATGTLVDQPASTIANGPNLTPSINSEFLVSGVGTAASVSSICTGSSWTNDAVLNGDGAAFVIATSTKTYAACWDQSSGGYNSAGASFKGVASGGGGTTGEGAVVNSFKGQMKFAGQIAFK